MGCDIHIFTEKKNRDGKWACTDLYEVNPYYDKDDESEPRMSHIDFYKGRNYELFGALAGVRNSSIKHIGAKGFPEGSSKECWAEFERWDSDAHTPSWLTLEELKQHQIDLGDTVERSGMISEEQLKDLERGIKPKEWCGWTNQKGFTQASWTDECKILDSFMDQLKAFLEFKYWKYEINSMKDTDFRVVFWFDN